MSERVHVKLSKRWAKKAATSSVINRLVTALGNEDMNVRTRVCTALGEIGEAAATSDVVKGLVNALGDVDGSVRESACKAPWENR